MTVNINNEWTMEFPEGFRVLTDEERQSMNFIENGPGVCLSDPDCHITISISWKKTGLLAALADPKDAIKTMEAKISRPMQQFGYRRGGFFERQIGGKSFSGFQYSYTAQNTDMTGESLIGKSGKVFYYLHFYARSEMPESTEVWKNILDSANWLR